MRREMQLPGLPVVETSQVGEASIDGARRAASTAACPTTRAHCRNWHVDPPGQHSWCGPIDIVGGRCNLQPNGVNLWSSRNRPAGCF